MTDWTIFMIGLSMVIMPIVYKLTCNWELKIILEKKES